jgi:hypothetical protein
MGSKIVSPRKLFSFFFKSFPVVSHTPDLDITAENGASFNFRKDAQDMMIGPATLAAVSFRLSTYS